MRKLLLFILAIAGLAACQNDDSYSIDDFVGNDTLTISYNGSTATVGALPYFVSVNTNGAHVIVNSFTSKYLVVSLSGTTTDGSLLVFSNKKYEIRLNGVTINNPKGPAINNQCGKSLHITLPAGTTNTLTDGTDYAEAPLNANGDTIQQKAALFSEGQIHFMGQGTLNVEGNSRNGIASDDYINFEGGTINVNVSATGTNGVKANDGVFIFDGTLTIDVKADGARGIKNDARMEISGGTTTITTSGNCLVETVNGINDTTSCAGIKCDSLMTMTAGTLTITSTGDGGKGINAAQAIDFKGGTLDVQATGSEDIAKPKAVKSDVSITLSGGTFHAYSRKSKAVDNAGEEEPAIVGTPVASTLKLTKREVYVEF